MTNYGALNHYKLAFFRKLFFLLLFISSITIAYSQVHFVNSRSGKFYIQNNEYKFIGANYWYGGYLAFDSLHDGKKRLKSELDFLKNHGVTNLRVFISSEGDSSYAYRISPSIQEKPRIYNEEILKSFDYLIVEAAKRNMKIVFVLNNNWEWSGGFGQYLEWSGEKDPILPKSPNWDWDKYCDYISKFYSCDSCIKWNNLYIEKIILRRNTLSQIYYKDDPTIMTWELANEPRPMIKNAIAEYKTWIEKTSLFIKSIDKNHLVTIGTEGIISTLMDSILYKDIHKIKSIDYATIHLWPKTWLWYNGESIHSTSDTSLIKSGKYITLHSKICAEINKPLVIEEFGMHRDNNVFIEYSSIKNRDKYYQYIFKLGNENNVSGYNFWGAFSLPKSQSMISNKSNFWKQGEPYTADPPQEEKGLYGVYTSDSSTWKIISEIAKSLK